MSVDGESVLRNRILGVLPSCDNAKMQERIKEAKKIKGKLNKQEQIGQVKASESKSGQDEQASQSKLWRQRQL